MLKLIFCAFLLVGNISFAKEVPGNKAAVNKADAGKPEAGKTQVNKKQTDKSEIAKSQEGKSQGRKPSEDIVLPKWAVIKKAINKTREIYLSKSISDSDKIKHLPSLNENLSFMTEVPESEVSTAERVKVAIDAVAAVVDHELGFTTIDTLSEDYVQHKAVYTKAINTLPKKETREKITEIFKGYEETLLNPESAQ